MGCVVKRVSAIARHTNVGMIGSLATQVESQTRIRTHILTMLPFGIFSGMIITIL
jgi:hypothetical protein